MIAAVVLNQKGKQIGSVLLAGELAAGDSVVNWKTTSARREIRSRFGGKLGNGNSPFHHSPPDLRVLD